MPVPSLPLELIELILSHLVSPISLTPPRFYRDLKCAALVCRSWAAPAQKLLWEQVYLSKGDKQVEKWLEVDLKPAWKVKSLVLAEQRDEKGLRFSYTPGILLQLFACCGGITSFSCDFSLESVYEAVPDFLQQFFPNLQSLRISHPYRRSTQSSALPPDLRILGILQRPPSLFPRLFISQAESVARSVAKDYEAGRFPMLSHLEVDNLAVLMSLKPLAPTLRTLVLPYQQSTSAVYLPGQSAPFDNLATFLAACSNLTHLVVPLLWDAELVEAAPSSVTHITISRVHADAFRTLCVDFEKLSESWTSDVELRINHEYDHWRLGDKVDVWKKVEESCARRGIKVVSRRLSRITIKDAARISPLQSEQLYSAAERNGVQLTIQRRLEGLSCCEQSELDRMIKKSAELFGQLAL
ncbi:hypothetical protein JCM10213_008187 [Rhodosporidiobolus nylandii]